MLLPSKSSIMAPFKKHKRSETKNVKAKCYSLQSHENLELVQAVVINE